MNITVPWNAAWTGEERYEIRPCRYAGGRLAVWQPFSPSTGRPIFAKPHMVRQRQSIANMVCTVCGLATAENDQWWFGLGNRLGDQWITTEAPVHRSCADHALGVCPHLRARGVPPQRLPSNPATIASLVGGDAFKADFGLDVRQREVVGALKLAWPWRQVAAAVMTMNMTADANSG